MFVEELYPTIFDKAAVYMFHIVQNHPFNDANKRTGFGATYLFLRANKAPIILSDEELENLVIDVAKGNLSKEKIANILEHGIND